MVVDVLFGSQVDAGRLPTAYHLDPSSMENPEDMAEVRVVSLAGGPMPSPKSVVRIHLILR